MSRTSRLLLRLWRLFRERQPRDFTIGTDPSVVFKVSGDDGQELVFTAEVDVRMSGTTSRFLLAVSALTSGRVTLDGHPAMRARPMRDGIRVARRYQSPPSIPTGRFRRGNTPIYAGFATRAPKT